MGELPRPRLDPTPVPPDDSTSPPQPSIPGSAYNRPLDYLRLTALLLMVFIHTFRGFLGWTGVDGILGTLGEAAPFPFFLALGMTSRRLVAKPAAVQLQRLGWFGLVAVWHSYYMWFSLHWEFFMCLWFAMSLLATASAVGLLPRHLAAVGLLLLAVNGMVPLNPGGHDAPDAWLRYGPFFPFPWIVPVLLGFGLGIEFPTRWRRGSVIVALAALSAIAVTKCILVAPQEPVGLRFLTEKNAATSAYMIAGTSGAVCFYLLLGWLRPAHAAWVRVDAGVRFLSERLLLATVLHHLSVRLITDPRWHWSVAVAFQRTASSTQLLELFVASAALLLLLLLSIDAAWRYVAARFEGSVGVLKLSWVIPFSIVAVYGMRLYIGVIGIFCFRWTAFVFMLIVALLGDRARRQSTTLPRVPTARAA